MEPSSTKLGSTLNVPNVQQLVEDQTLTSVPTRYIQPTPDLHHHHHHHHLTPLPEIPIIDMSKLSNQDSMDSELHKLHKACKEWGFFQLINHGVGAGVREKMKREMEGFFNMGLDEKMKFSQKEGDVEGYGQAFVFSEEQKLDWADLFYLITLPQRIRNPHFIPNFPSALRDAVEAYSSELKTLAMKILEQMAKALGMKWEEMEAMFEEGMQMMRMNYYPPCPQPELVTGIRPHSDGGALTILLQLNRIDGLQVRKDGIRIPVSSLPNAFIVNIGDMLEVVTNGNYRSVEHKATVNAEKARLSIATFLTPNLEVDLGPEASLGSPPKFKRIKVEDYLKGFFSRELKGKSFLDTMRL